MSYSRFQQQFGFKVRETETWMPPKAGESNDDLDSSGDFIFRNEERTFVDDDDDDDDDEEDDYEDAEDFDMSGSGDDESITNEENKLLETGVIDNSIQDTERSGQPRPTINDIELVRQNEVGHHPSVQLSHAGEQNIFNKTEVLAAVIAGGAVGLLFAVLLILLFVYRMKKKDEGSYDLGKKPIYKKAPTTEIYA
ncbi:syndecan-4 isoform X2 [Hemibagrus wyckioides]|uniref:syndecan-4 isoform X2 n=1 Tax=Hemibagrus wyckioides TaxID=337641 RepID=UPI00266B94AC|nr:syndecan-4 isoform X2 [Hemibagrus wyckioides]